MPLSIFLFSDDLGPGQLAVGIGEEVLVVVLDSIAANLGEPKQFDHAVAEQFFEDSPDPVTRAETVRFESMARTLRSYGQKRAGSSQQNSDHCWGLISLAGVELRAPQKPPCLIASSTRSSAGTSVQYHLTARSPLINYIVQLVKPTRSVCEQYHLFPGMGSSKLRGR